MRNPAGIRGLAQVNVFADDVSVARDWCANILGQQAYFQRPDDVSPAYVEFRIGDHADELGIMDRAFQPPVALAGPGG